MVTIPCQGILRILEHWRSVAIGQRNRTHARQESHWGHGTNVKATQVVLATHVRTLERRRNQAAKPTDKRALNVEAEGIAAVLYRDEFLVLHDGPNRPNRPAQTCEFRTHRELVPVVGRDWTVDGIKGKVGKDLAGDDSVQRVGPGNATEGQELEQILGCRAQSQQRGPVERIGNPHALEGAAQRIA